MTRRSWDPDELVRLRRARDLMERRYADPLDVPALARAAHMSPSHFARRFRAAYGETPCSFLMTRRVERAMALLRRGDMTVTEVCMAVGATSLGSFSSRQFRRSRARSAGPNVAAMSISVSHTFVIVDDQDKALAFYRDVLGLQVVTDAPLGPMRWLTLGSPDQPGLEIGLMPPDMGHSPEDAQALSELLAKGVLGSLIFRVDDCDETFERLRAAGAEVIQEPIDQPYGVRDCAFRDPSGNHLRFSAG